MDLAVEGHPGLVAGAAEIRQVGDHGVDDEPPRPVVRAEPEPDYALGVEGVVGGHRTPDAADSLVRDGAWLTDVAGGRVHDEGSLAVHLDPLGAVDAEPDPVRIGARRDDEVVLEPAWAAVVDELDAGIDGGVAHRAVRGRADRRRRTLAEVVDDARELPVSEDPRGRIDADGLQMDGGVRPELQNRFRGGEERRVSRAARHELHLRVGLAAIGFEDERTRCAPIGRRSRGPDDVRCAQQGQDRDQHRDRRE